MQPKQEFNLYFNGANEKRNQPKTQTREKSQKRSTSNTRSDSKGQRRQWLAAQTSEKQIKDQVGAKPSYQNPVSVKPSNLLKFDLGDGGNPFQSPLLIKSGSSHGKKPVNMPSGARKQWKHVIEKEKEKQQAFQEHFLGSDLLQSEILPDSESEGEQVFEENDSSSEEDQNQKAMEYLKGHKKQIDEEDEYSDSFESGGNQIDRKQDHQVIEDLLKTATKEQLDTLSKSLSNFQEARKITTDQERMLKNAGNLDLNAQVKFIGRNSYEKPREEEDDYIEEEFEEDKSDSIEDLGEDNIEERLAKERMEQLEKQRQEQIRLANLSKNSQRNARPISATVNLVTQKVSTVAAKQTETKYMTEVAKAVAEENKRVAKTQRPMASAKVQQPQKINPIFQASHQAPQKQDVQKYQQPFTYTNVQHREEMKMPVASKPFNRPTSHIVAKRPGHNFSFDAQAPEPKPQFKNEETSFTRTEQSLGPMLQQPAQKVDVDELLKKIFNLDDTQRHALFQILKTLDSKGDLSSTNLNQGLQIFLSQNEKATESVSNHTEVLIRVLSTLGNPHVCGLTEIELFDINSNKIALSPSCIMIKNQGRGPKVSVDKLINGVKLTNDEKQMWLGYLPLPPKHLEIQIRVASSVKVGGLKLWNYNKGIFDCTKGVFQLQVLLNENIVWEGSLEPGRGYVNKDYSKAIVLTSQPDFKFPVEQMPEAIETPKATKTVEILDESKEHSVKEVTANQDMLFVKREVQPALKVEEVKENIVEPKAESKQPIWLAGQDLNNARSVQQKAKSNRPSEYRLNLVQQTNINETIQQAVMSVNKAIESSRKTQREKSPVRVEESLETLEYFNVTNLGRLHTEVQASALQEARKSTYAAEIPVAGERPKWVQKIDLEQGSAKDVSVLVSQHKAPRIKSPFPNDPKPTSISSKPQDFLDEMLNMQSAKAVDVSKPEAAKPDAQSKKSEAKTQAESLAFIPTLPQGQVLKFNITETWGDMNYLGLTGIEIFDVEGNQIQISENNISAFPPDVNVLPGYGTDPRTVEKLVDGHYFTNDDLHVWLTPFTSGEDHTITIDLGKKTILSMIRVWNYNKSRIHSYRGAKMMSCQLDGKQIFKGEIRKAPGNTNDPEQCCEIILFTDNDNVLDRIDKKDWLNQHEIVNGLDNTQRISDFTSENGFSERPMTATKKFSAAEIEDLQYFQQQVQRPKSMFDERPQTQANVQSERIGEESARKPKIEADTINVTETKPLKEKPSRAIKGRTLQINIKESWGDLFYVGLNGLQVLDENGQAILITVTPQMDIETGKMTKTKVDAEPRDMNAIPGHDQDHRTLEKLFNGVNNTTDDRNMWLIPFNKGENHIITIDFGCVRTISAVRFFNYNKSLEDTLRGSKQVIIKVDQRLMTPKKGITLRKAPGFIEEGLDIGQEIKLPFLQGWTTEQIGPLQNVSPNPINFFQEYETVGMPVGFTVKINLYSTHGDFYYIGLNGIELFDQNGKNLLATQKYKLYAHPLGVFTISGMESDIRRVQNLVDGKNSTSEEDHIWLTLFKNTRSTTTTQPKDEDQAKRREPNYVLFMFEEPVAISVARIWNYSKTPQRGVNEFEIEVDGLRVFRGFARKAPDEVGSFSTRVRDWSTTVIFGGREEFLEQYARQIYYDPTKKQSVTLLNERKLITGLKQRDASKFDEKSRPDTRVGSKLKQ